jgi:phosphoribosyl 1,2-cyclic phosphodiesterase
VATQPKVRRTGLAACPASANRRRPIESSAGFGRRRLEGETEGLPPRYNRADMPLSFRSLRSSSSGNCLAVWTEHSSILIDFGVKTLRDCRALLRDHQEQHGPVRAVLVSHSHGDHLSTDAVRILGEQGIAIHTHAGAGRQLRERYAGGRRVTCQIHHFPADRFAVDDLEIQTVTVPHAPGIPTVGFVIRVGHGPRRRTAVVATDFYDFSTLLPHLPGADFVFVEANHDLDLLRRHFNPNSRWHLNNVKTAWMLCHAAREGRFRPRAVVLGHLSRERNRESLAIGEVQRVFERQQMAVPFDLDAAPRYEPSRVFRIE